MSIEQALIKALVLAITAPTDEKAQQAAELADKFAGMLDGWRVERCKLKAIKRAAKVPV